MTSDFPGPAAGQERHERDAFRDTEPAPQIAWIGRRLHQSGQRMTNVRGGNMLSREELFFERKDAKQPVDDSSHQRQSALSPGPNLRGHQVHDWDAKTL